MANGVSCPSALAMPIAMAVFPVPGWPASSTARPAMRPSRIMLRMTPAACVGGRHGRLLNKHSRDMASHAGNPHPDCRSGDQEQLTSLDLLKRSVAATTQCPAHDWHGSLGEHGSQTSLRTALR